MSRSYADTTNAALEYLNEMAAATTISNPDVSATYEKLSELFSQKLWHQLTVLILDLVSPSANSAADYNFLEIYDRVVLACDSKLNQLSLARIATYVAFSLPDDNTTQGKELLRHLVEKKGRLGYGATLFLESKLVLLALRDFTTTTTTATEKEVLRESIHSTLQDGAQRLAEEGSMDLIVHSAYYEAATAFRKLVGPPEEFYKEALLYLHYTPLETMSEHERYTLATDLSLAAITGDGIFNFGELTTTPLLQTTLLNTPNAWLMDLLQCFAQGDVPTFTQVMDRASLTAASSTYPVLVARASVVQEKITLLALVHTIFERPSSDRTLSFEDISHRTTVSKEHVELLLMRALSLRLIQGTMDQVDQTITVTWVMPRVLEPLQLQDLAGRFGEWAIKVSQAKDYLVEHTPTLA